MAGKTSKTKPLNVRIPNKEYFLIEDYAKRTELNRSQAVLSLIRKGLELSKDKPATSEEITALRAELQSSFQAMARALENQPIAVQEALPAPEVEELAKMSIWEFRKWRKGKNGTI